MSGRWLFSIFAVAAMTATQLRAQSPAERAAVARDAWRRAAASDRAGLADSVWADLLRAHAAWPMQPAYTEAVARYAARRGDTVVLERVLRLLAAQGVGGAAAIDSAIVATVARTAGGAAALAAVRRGIEPVERSQPRILSPDTLFFAEGLDADSASGTLYITSIRHRAVYAVAADGRMQMVLGATHDAFAAPLGVAFDRARRALWVTTAGLPHMAGYESSDSARAELLRVRLAEGVITGLRMSSQFCVPAAPSPSTSSV
jgi:hypothetical protein